MGWRDRDDDDYDDIKRPRRSRRRKKTAKAGLGLGLGSLGIAVITFFLVAGVFVMAAFIGPRNDRDPAIMLVGFGIIGALFIAAVGVVLGAVGAFVSDTTGMICSIIGLAVNVLIVFGVLGVMCLGLLVKH